MWLTPFRVTELGVLVTSANIGSATYFIGATFTVGVPAVAELAHMSIMAPAVAGSNFAATSIASAIARTAPTAVVA
jgi:hypothetical protein